MDKSGQSKDEPTERVRSRRALCRNCERPERVCLCEWLPKDRLTGLPESFERVLLLQHPQEKKQKHQSDFFLLRCLESVYTAEGRELGSTSACPPIPPKKEIRVKWKKHSDSIWREKNGIDEITAPRDLELDPKRCRLLFPSDDSTIERGEEPEMSDKGFGQKLTLIAIDATWTYAREMVQRCPDLRTMQRVQLSAGTVKAHPPAFVIRKPQEVKVKTKSDKQETIQGYSTAEAVALYLDQSGNQEKKCHAAILPAIKGYVRLQLRCVSEAGGEVAHRKDRPGYDPKLYKAYDDASNGDDTVNSELS